MIARIKHELVIGRKEIVGDEADRSLLEHGLTGRPATQAPLKHGERARSTPVLGIDRDELSVEHQADSEPSQRGHDVRIALSDVVESAREEAHLVAVDVRLGADAVVLVLDHERRGHRRNDGLWSSERLGEHEADRVEQRQAGRRERAVSCEDGDLTDVAS